MFRTIDYSEIYSKEDGYVLVDVRSESEYNEATITGSINIPILRDKEREIVGTTYVKEDTEKAKKQGIEFAAERLPVIFNEFQRIIKENRGKRIVIFCARGGMRSGSVHGLLNGLGMHVLKLDGGYKKYRAFVVSKLEEFSKEVKFVSLYGNTGVGKTEILYELKKRGYNIMDIEGAANHRGSVLGAVGFGEGYIQKKFETILYDQLKTRNNNIVFTEGESRRINKVIIPQNIWDTLHKGQKVYITADLLARADRLVREYTSFDNAKEEIINSLDHLKGQASEENISYYKELVLEGDFRTVAMNLMEKYYDPKYGHGAKKNIFRENFHANTVDEAMKNLERIYKEINKEEVLEDLNGK